MDFDLDAHWHHHTQTLTADPAAVFAELHRAYTEPHRHYHTLRHIAAMFALLDNQSATTTTAFWATWFHDIVYNPLGNDNEERSADMAHAQLTALGVDAACIEDVERWILATKTHQVDLQRPLAEQTFLDADMAILGVEPAVYATYTERVRQEFIQVSDVLYRRGRRQFVEKTLAMSHIFGTPWFIENFEDNARHNLRGELVRLS